jgi:hypothetical protein
MYGKDRRGAKEEDEDVSSYWMALRKREYNRN